jgi:four helix bundle protein
MDFAERFEDLKIWQTARVLANRVFDAMESNRNYSFSNQIMSAATSSMNNIAEGFERRTKKDFAHFLDIAKGSSGEVRSMLYLAEDRKYIATQEADDLRSRYERLSSSIGALASKLRK